MTGKIFVLIFLATLRADAQMLQGVWIEPRNVQLTVGSSATLRANAILGCCSNFPWKVRFTSAAPAIALAGGLLQAPATSAPVKVTGKRPGVTNIVSPDIGYGQFPLATVVVTCDVVPALLPESPQLATAPGRPVMLRIVTTPIEEETFAWYLGRLGDDSHPLRGDGPELQFTTSALGTHFVWVQSMAACRSGIIEFRIDVSPARRRAVSP